MAAPNPLLVLWLLHWGILESHTQAIKCSNLESTHSLLLTGQQEFPSLPSNKGAGKIWFAASQSWLPTSCTIASVGTSEDGGKRSLYVRGGC